LLSVVPPLRALSKEHIHTEQEAACGYHDGYDEDGVRKCLHAWMFVIMKRAYA